MAVQVPKTYLKDEAMGRITEALHDLYKEPNCAVDRRASLIDRLTEAATTLMYRMSK